MHPGNLREGCELCYRRNLAIVADRASGKLAELVQNQYIVGIVLSRSTASIVKT